MRWFSDMRICNLIYLKIRKSFYSRIWEKSKFYFKNLVKSGVKIMWSKNEWPLYRKSNNSWWFISLFIINPLITCDAENYLCKYVANEKMAPELIANVFENKKSYFFYPHNMINGKYLYRSSGVFVAFGGSCWVVHLIELRNTNAYPFVLSHTINVVYPDYLTAITFLKKKFSLVLIRDKLMHE